MIELSFNTLLIFPFNFVAYLPSTTTRKEAIWTGIGNRETTIRIDLERTSEHKSRDTQLAFASFNAVDRESTDALYEGDKNCYLFFQ